MQKNTHTLNIDIKFYPQIIGALSNIVERSSHILTKKTDKKTHSWARYRVESELSLLNTFNERWQMVKSHHNHLDLIDFYARLEGIKTDWYP